MDSKIIEQEVFIDNEKGCKACGLHCIMMENIAVKLDDQYIIKNINLHIHCGKITAIIGKNGAGKSTLIKAITGEYHHSGTIQLTDIKNNVIRDMKIGYVPQTLKLDKNSPISVYDLFASFINNKPVCLFKSKSVYRRIKEQLSIFEADRLIDRRISDLSGGELQRVLLSIAVTPIPNLLLLDEPISGIDRRGMEIFYSSIQNLKSNYDLAMIIVSHDFDFVRKYADHVILLNRTIVKEGTAEEVLESKEFYELFS